MKRSVYLLTFLVSLLMISCNKIPDKSIFTSLSAEELAAVIKAVPDFADFYEDIHDDIDEFNELEKAKFMDITYHDMYKVKEYMEDTTVWIPLREQWSAEWSSKYGIYEEKIDSVLDYWTEYKRSNSLDRFVQISFDVIDKEYYTYSNDVKEVDLGFKIKPLQGSIDQVKFRYRYSAKINDFYGEWHNCICTSPISRETTRYWEVGYSDRDKFKGITTSSFIRDYDIQIEVTNVRSNGINYSEDDFNIPKCVKDVFDTDPDKYPYLYEARKKDIIPELLCKSYVREYAYISDKMESVIKEKFPREYTLIEYIEDK